MENEIKIIQKKPEAAPRVLIEFRMVIDVQVTVVHVVKSDTSSPPSSTNSPSA